MEDANYYARARVEAEGLVLEEPARLPIGSRFEGYSIPSPPPKRLPFVPIGAEEAKRRFGESLADAIARRGIDLDAIDWSNEVEIEEGEFNPMSWYRIVHNLDPSEPCAQWLPFFAHVLRIVEEGGSFWSHLENMSVCVPSGVRSASAAQVKLTALLVARVQEAVLESRYVRISEFHEAALNLHEMTMACLWAHERPTPS